MIHLHLHRRLAGHRLSVGRRRDSHSPTQAQISALEQDRNLGARHLSVGIDRADTDRVPAVSVFPREPREGDAARRLAGVQLAGVDCHAIDGQLDEFDDGLIGSRVRGLDNDDPGGDGEPFFGRGDGDRGGCVGGCGQCGDE